jgi:5-oxoprolinase (ATP-hydrolysing)
LGDLRLIYLFSGGLEGGKGANYWVKKNPDGSERWVSMGPKNMVQMQTGDRCVIHTPGGGGWGAPGTALAISEPTLSNVPNGVSHLPRAMGSIAAFEETQAGQH